MGLMSRFAVVSVVGIAVLLAILYEMSEASAEKEEGVEATSVIPNPPRTDEAAEETGAVVKETTEDVSTEVVMHEPESLFGESHAPKPTLVEKSEQSERKQMEKRKGEKVKKVSEERFYMVKKGDTLYSIARRFYGDGKMWSVIWKANRGVVKEPSRLAAGVRLRLPDHAEEKEDPEYETYIVQKGDTLSKISRLHYGTSKFVDLILEANRDTIREPGRLRVGMLVRIPPLPSE